jgi:hypothetical protein
MPAADVEYAQEARMFEAFVLDLTSGELVEVT